MSRRSRSPSSSSSHRSASSVSVPLHSASHPPGIDARLLRATETGTEAYVSRFINELAPGYFRATTFGLTVSSVGIGTYLGESTDEDDAAYELAIQRAFQIGVNLVDTAINYRNQRSEQAVGAAIQQALAAGDIARDQIVVCSKGGYVPLDRTPPASRDAYQAYVQREFIDEGILHRDELVAGGHSLAPRFLRYCLAKSRQNLGLRTIDVYYVHNPEQQLGSVDEEELYERLREAFRLLEEEASRGEIGVYGCATWDGLRTPPGTAGHLSLERLVQAARDVGGDRHRFRVIQLPINLAMTEAVRAPTQLVDGTLMTVVEAAAALEITVIGSASLMQASLSRDLPPALHEHFPNCQSDAQRALTFARTLPGVTAALVGMKQAAHVDENLEPART